MSHVHLHPQNHTANCLNCRDDRDSFSTNGMFHIGSTLIAHLWSPHVTELAKADGSRMAPHPGYLLRERVWCQNNMLPCRLPFETDAAHPIWSGQNHIRISLSAWAICALSPEVPPHPPTYPQCNQCLSHNNPSMLSEKTLKNGSTQSSTVFTSNQSFEESHIIGGVCENACSVERKVCLIQRPSCTA